MQEKMTEETKMEEMVKEGNAEDIAEECHTKKKRKFGIIRCIEIFVMGTFALFLIFILGVFIKFIWLISPHIETDFATTQEFIDYGGYICVDIPESASDIKYYCNDMYFTVESACSYVISDEKEFENFLETNEFEIKSDSTVADYNANPPVFGGEIDIFDWYDYVVDDDIRDYYVLNYYSFDGSFRVLIADEETRRIVAIRFSTF